MPTIPPSPALRTVLACLPLLMAACRDAKVTSYRIPKENDPAVAESAAAPAAGDMAETAVVKAEGADLLWTAPGQWKPKVASALRKGSYTVGEAGGPTADLAITAFPGDVGGEIANVNRWRAQLQLPPLAEPELAGAVTRLNQNGLAISFVELAGGPAADNQRMLGAIVPFNGATWFFKLTGPDALVAQEKPAFLAFLQTVKPAAALPSTAAPVQPAVGAPAPGGMTGAAVVKAEGPALAWTAPARWQSKPGSAIRKGSYNIPGEGGAMADLSITAFPGAVGGESANINRWRGQLSLPPLAESELAPVVTHLAANGLVFTVVDFAGPGANPQRILGAMVPYEGAMWFFKLTGPDALVAQEKPAFLEFLKTVRAATPATP